MAPHAIHFIRHAEGYHNLLETEDIPDPDLTPKGKDQCEQLATIFPFFDRIDLVCASPIRRALQTALISTEPYLRSGKRKILALPLAQEATDTPANTPSDISRLQDEFGHVVDFHRCLAPYNDFNTKKGRWSPEGPALRARALELRKFLRSRDEREIVVVSHGNFLHYITGDIDDDGKETTGWWKNAEFRTYRYVEREGADALLEETKESVRMRGASGPGEVIGSAGTVNGKP
ncbi:histidine phosphatase superfamily [Paraphoma chrysanthemicola]|uniref:Histidine phosphatase superfamily n=1 Tax=Paraphoma chrysanthemicola TaxID=798071 RepID=A0A8K0W1I7_9PLEO|nr:histidine phosphatase superfamily [Paraphoma chrysanthemicola]